MFLSKLKKSFFMSEEAEKMWNDIEDYIQSDEECCKFYTSASFVDDMSIVEDIFSDLWCGDEILAILKRIHRKKYIYRTLCEKGKLVRTNPFVVEFTGTPRAGKTTTIRNLEDFFKKAGFKVRVIEELTTSQYYKQFILKKKASMPLGEYNLLILEESFKKLQEAFDSDVDIVLVDRGINDRQVWNYLRLNSGDIAPETYRKVTNKYVSLSKKYVNVLFALCAKTFTAVSRDYTSHINLETRRFNRYENIDKFNKALEEVSEIHKKAVPHFMKIDSDVFDPVGISIIAANQILDIMLDEALSSVSV